MKLFRRISLYITAMLIMLSFSVFADQPPNPGGGPGGGDDPVGGGAPIGGGFLILIIASSVYGFFKSYYSKSDQK